MATSICTTRGACVVNIPTYHSAAHFLSHLTKKIKPLQRETDRARARLYSTLDVGNPFQLLGDGLGRWADGSIDVDILFLCTDQGNAEPCV